MADSAHVAELRAELQRVLQSHSFLRSPGLSRLLSYLCDKALLGESDQIKEYSVALDVFGRQESFDQDSDSIVRVQANRLRKRLTEYYAGEGRAHRIHITIPVGQYVPVFAEAKDRDAAEGAAQAGGDELKNDSSRRTKISAGIALISLLIAVALTFALILRPRVTTHPRVHSASPIAESATPTVGLPVGDEIRILAGSTRSYVDRSGKLWSPDAFFTGGSVIRSSLQHLWRTQDPAIYRSSRQGDFKYDIPLKAGIYELHLHFAETYYGPEDIGGGGESSRVMMIMANGRHLLTGFDVLADAGEARSADVKVFTDVSPAGDGFLHLSFSPISGTAMVSAIEILPGYRGRMRPVRIVAREVPYYSNDSQWWSSDVYFKGGQLAGSEEAASDTDDAELYESERWGHFSYAVPVAPGQYKATLHFIERGIRRAGQGLISAAAAGDSNSEDRVFDVFCNGKAIVRHLNLREEAGENRPLARKISGLEPNAQGKLLLEFVPLRQYATVSAIEVVQQ
jgi:hypothetical protein